MKLLTVNLHSYVEENWQSKLKVFTEYIEYSMPDAVAMQEVNQTLISPACNYIKNTFAINSGIPLRADNYGLKIMEMLNDKNCDYHYVWLGIKKSYGRFEEGIGFLLKNEPLRFRHILLSKTDNTDNWKKRMALGVKYDGAWLYSVHMGRWDDKEEPFQSQWNILNNSIGINEKAILMGDFNAPSDALYESYDAVLSDGWKDSYTLAKDKDDGFTVKGNIDGWKDKKEDFSKKRIDYIFTNYNCNILSSQTVFNGKNQEIISDHYAVEVNMEG